MEQKKNNGITLIALVITIIVLLILAGVSIITIISDDGIIKKAGQSKYEMQVAEEKQIIGLSNASGKIDFEIGNEITLLDYKNNLIANSGNRPIKVYPCVDILIVDFEDTNRYYEVNKNTGVDGPFEKIEDSFPGDVTKDGNLDGSKENPYQINCIEDLIGMGIEVANQNHFTDKYVVFNRSLDFENPFSYENYKSKVYGDINHNGIVEEIKIELTNKDEGCTGYPPIGDGGNTVDNRLLNVKWDGQNHEIKNIYINSKSHAGLIGGQMHGEMKNLGITGTIISTEKYAGGLQANGPGVHLYNCYNKASVKAKQFAGGIAGGSGWFTINVKNCINYGKIECNSYAGGIMGSAAGIIDNCINYAEVTSMDGHAGGILGQAAGKDTIINSVNFGKVTGPAASGGISGGLYAGITVYNCCNFGEVYASRYFQPSVSGIRGTSVKNCFSNGMISLKNGIPYNFNTCQAIGSETVEKSYYDSSKFPKEGKVENNVTDVKDKSMQEIADLLNGYKDPTTGEFPSDWKKWKVGEDGLLRIVN